MRRILCLTAAGLCLVSVPGLIGAQGADLKAPAFAQEDPASTCGNHGTSVTFLDTPAEAARKALKEQKLVFVLHVSGLFEDPKLT